MKFLGDGILEQKQFEEHFRTAVLKVWFWDPLGSLNFSGDQ